MAEELVNYRTNSNSREACLRSSISRGYYGIYCVARNFLIKQGQEIPLVDTHKFVREKYQGSSDLRKKKIAKNLKRLWAERKVADYKNEAEISLKGAETALLLCKATLQYLEENRNNMNNEAL